MARSASKKGEPSSTRSRRKTMQHPSKGNQGQVQDMFGKDPWTASNDCHDDARSQSSATQPLARTRRLSLRSQLMSHFGGQEEKKTSSVPITENVKPSDEEDDVAIPTPIHAMQPYQLIAPDGHVQLIYEPIPGFEHLFKVPDSSQGTPSSRHLATAASPPQQSQGAAATSPQHAAHDEDQQRCSKYSRKSAASPRNDAEPKWNCLKRSRSVAHGLSQSRRAYETSDAEDKIDHAGDENEEAVAVVNEASKSFQVGDIDGLKSFLRARIDELTMKPVRSMVTSWVKKLEPKRKGGYGPYHKMLPSAAPEDATPPWWPRTVPYIEPAHLDKDGLMTLAIDIILQHRDIPVDELKRLTPWTGQLQRVAEFEVSMLPAEQYSSSRNVAFSTAMKERAEQNILPSLFDVVQSYEDHVFMYELWRYKDVKEAPKGKTITWQLIPRPTKQLNRAKRPRRATRPKMEPLSLPKELLLEDDDESSGNDTVPDETMLKIATELVRLKEAKAARRKAKAAAAQARLTQPSTPERTVEASTPSIMGASSGPATPQVQLTVDTKNTKSAFSSSFDQSMDHLCLKDETKVLPTLPENQTQPAPLNSVTQSPNQPAQCRTPQGSFVNTPLQHEQDDAKGGSFMSSEHHALSTPMQYHSNPSPYANHTLPHTDDEDVKGGTTMAFVYQAQQSVNGVPPLVDAMQYNNRHAGYGTEALRPLQGMGSFADAGPSHYTQFASQYIDPSDLALFNSFYPAQMAHSPYESGMAASNMDCTYNSEAMFTPMTVTVPSTPRQAKSSFSGLPYDFTGPPRQ